MAEEYTAQERQDAILVGMFACNMHIRYAEKGGVKADFRLVPNGDKGHLELAVRDTDVASLCELGMLAPSLGGRSRYCLSNRGKDYLSGVAALRSKEDPLDRLMRMYAVALPHREGSLLTDPASLPQRDLWKHRCYMRAALELAQLSKCRRAKYASLIVGAAQEPIAWGYNGKPAGAANDAECYREGLAPDAKSAKCCLHSEQNAYGFADLNRARGGTFYVTGVPCEDCALLVLQMKPSILVCLEDPRDYPGLRVIPRYGIPLTVLLLSREYVLGAYSENAPYPHENHAHPLG